MNVKTRGNSNPKGKSRVFFTCHPSDMNKCFEKICEDVFKGHDAAIYYIEDDPYDPCSDDLLETNLRQMSLFIIPISLKLLTDKCFTIEIALPFAKREHIPILPIMLEPGLETIYGDESMFGTLQFLDPYSTDPTSIGYEKKLSDYLDHVLIGDELANRVRKAFDAYVFLSYRKKDRFYANELMRLIHKDPLCRDIAIWYDEYLTPGEAFDDAIKKAMEKSELFTLLVTPNLINETNYVQTEEYPRAQRSDISILPIEMIETDHNLLKEKFPGVPECVSKNDPMLRELFLSNIKRLATNTNDNDPEHNYLIGCAYLDGIDVEVDRERGVELIKLAANDGLPEAMAHLAYMYHEGIGVDRYMPLFLEWLEKLVSHYESTHDSDEIQLLNYQNTLAREYMEWGRLEEAINLSKKVYEAYKRIKGADNIDTITCLGNLASIYGSSGEYTKSIELNKQVYEYEKRELGADNESTITTLNNLAVEYSYLGKHEEALELFKNIYESAKKTMGEEHSKTLNALRSLANEYSELGDHESAISILLQICRKQEQLYGSNNMGTLVTLNNLALEYKEIGNNEKAQELSKKAYEANKRILGEHHYNTIKSLFNLGTIYADKDSNKAFKYFHRAYESLKSSPIDDNSLMVQILLNLANINEIEENHEYAINLLEQLYTIYISVLGKTNSETLRVLTNIGYEYGMIGNHEKAIQLDERAYKLCRRYLGENNELTLIPLKNLAYEYGEIGNHDKAKELYDQILKMTNVSA